MHLLWLTGVHDPQSNLDSHTIILLQPVPDRRSRTFLDFETVGNAVDGTIPHLAGLQRLQVCGALNAPAAAGVCGLFEKRLKELNPTRRQITYDVQGALLARQRAD